MQIGLECINTNITGHATNRFDNSAYLSRNIIAAVHRESRKYILNHTFQMELRYKFFGMSQPLLGSDAVWAGDWWGKAFSRLAYGETRTRVFHIDPRHDINYLCLNPSQIKALVFTIRDDHRNLTPALKEMLIRSDKIGLCDRDLVHKNWIWIPDTLGRVIQFFVSEAGWDNRRPREFYLFDETNHAGCFAERKSSPTAILGDGGGEVKAAQCPPTRDGEFV